MEPSDKRLTELPFGELLERLAAATPAVGDATTPTRIAEAACASAAILLELNLSAFADERPGQAAQCVRRAGSARQQALSKAREG